jgi:AcrR family transcriptional regulator
MVASSAEFAQTPVEPVASVSDTTKDPDPAELRPDGRSLRRERNRQRVIEALIDLIREGEHEPGAAAIADRAGVSHRSVFRYFDDMGDLVREVIRTEFAQVVEVAGLGDLGVGPLEDRIDRLVFSRVTAYDMVYEIERVARLRAGEIPAVAYSLTRIDGLLRRELEEHFATELADVDAETRDTTLDLLVTITSFESFDLLRRSYGRSDEEIRTRWMLALHQLLPAAPGTAD